MKIVLAGGGTGGSVSPLLAVYEEIKRIAPKTDCFFIGTGTGPERDMALTLGANFYSVPSGKLRRYFSFKNFGDIFLIIAGFLKSYWLLRKIRPNIIFTAGSYVGVPVAYAGFLVGAKIIGHQQDVVASLSNKLILPVATKITTSLQKSVKDFASGSGLLRRSKNHKLIFTGNPVRAQILQGNAVKAKKFFGLSGKLPVLLVLGGGTGAEVINKAIYTYRDDLLRVFEIIHVTGKNKLQAVNNPFYHQYEFLEVQKIGHAMKVAEIVVSRAGFSTISELSALGKASVIVPMPDSHQLANAYYLFVNQAAVVARQEEFASVNPVWVLRKILFDNNLLETLRNNIRKLYVKDAAAAIAKVIINAGRSN